MQVERLRSRVTKFAHRLQKVYFLQQSDIPFASELDQEVQKHRQHFSERKNQLQVTRQRAV
jgi:hypothetical protein